MDAIELLRQNEQKDLLRLVTAGSVDDGKSTLIGRLLFESKGIYEDQLASVRKASLTVGTTGDDLDLALVRSLGWKRISKLNLTSLAVSGFPSCQWAFGLR